MLLDVQARFIRNSREGDFVRRIDEDRLPIAVTGTIGVACTT
ncbi:hypothetical protein [Bogoriella caseilytica]|nr:hypothetical protein [Bogoriella caseilytica]